MNQIARNDALCETIHFNLRITIFADAVYEVFVETSKIQNARCKMTEGNYYLSSE